jgi:hypothetical protein
MDSGILMIQDSILVCSPDPRIPHTAWHGEVKILLVEECPYLGRFQETRTNTPFSALSGEIQKSIVHHLVNLSSITYIVGYSNTSIRDNAQGWATTNDNIHKKSHNCGWWASQSCKVAKGLCRTKQQQPQQQKLLQNNNNTTTNHNNNNQDSSFSSQAYVIALGRQDQEGHHQKAA